MTDSQRLTKISSAQPIGRPFKKSNPHFRLSFRRPTDTATSDFFANSVCAIHGARMEIPSPNYTNSLIADMLPISTTDFISMFSARK